MEVTKQNNFIDNLANSANNFYQKHAINIFDIGKKLFNASVSFVAGMQVIPLAGSLSANPVASMGIAMAANAAVMTGSYLAMRKLNPMKDLNNSFLYKNYKNDKIPPLSKAHVFKRVRDAEQSIINEPFNLRDKHVVAGQTLSMKQKLNLAEGIPVAIRPKFADGRKSEYFIGIERNAKQPGGLSFEKIHAQQKESLINQTKIFIKNSISKEPLKVKHASFNKEINLSKTKKLTSKEESIENVKNIANKLKKDFKQSNNQIKPKIRNKTLKPGRFY